MRDVPLPVGPDDLGVRPWDRDQVGQVFDTLQFRVLRDRLYATLQTAEPEADQGFDIEVQLLGPDHVAAWLTAHTGPRHAPGSRWPAPGAVAPAVDRGRAGDGRWRGRLARPGRPDPDDDAALATWLADAEQPKALHDAKGPMLAMAAQGWTLAGVSCDTALAAYLALPGQRSFDLSDLVLRFLHRELRAETGEPASSPSTAPTRPTRRRLVRAGPSRPRPRRRRSSASSRTVGHRIARGRRAAAGGTSWPAWSRSGSRSTPTTWPTSRPLRRPT